MADEDMPRDGKIVKELLRSMNIDDYEPQVVNQFLELWYRYIADVLTDAQLYSEHAEKSAIDSDDVKLAIQSKVNFSFSQPPPREALLELARSRNKVPLPRSISGHGLRLPPDQDTLISPNYQLAIPKRQISQTAEETEEDEDAAIPPNPDQNVSQNQEIRHKVLSSYLSHLVLKIKDDRLQYSQSYRIAAQQWSSTSIICRFSFYQRSLIVL